MRRYIVIGTGVAGFAAAESIRGIDPAGTILMIGNEQEGFYSRPGLAYYLTGELAEKQLFPFSKQDFKQLDVNLLHAKVIQISPMAHELYLQNGDQIHYDRLLIANGASATMMNIPGSGAQGVVKLDNLTDARLILKLTRKLKSAVVVGGGITALEIAEGLVARGLKVHLFIRSAHYWRNVLTEHEARIIEAHLAEEGVQIHCSTQLSEILTQNNHVVGVRTQANQQIKCELLAMAIGIRPRTALANASGLKIDRGLLTNEYLETSGADIFAAGDVAQVFDPLTGTSNLQSLWSPARRQGEVAGFNMAGQRSPYIRTIHVNVTRLANRPTTIIGSVGSERDHDSPEITRGESETWRQQVDAVSIQSDDGENHVRVMVGPQTLLGAVVIGDQAISRPLQELITRQVCITPIRAKLLAPGTPITDLINSLWYLNRNNPPHGS